MTRNQVGNCLLPRTGHKGLRRCERPRDSKEERCFHPCFGT